jgi:hypothetical protein
MSVTCDNNNEDMMDAYSIQMARRDSSHCFYQNRGDLIKIPLSVLTIQLIQISFSYLTVIQPLLTGELY